MLSINRDLVEFVKAAMDKPLEVSTIFPTSSTLANRLLNQMEENVPGPIVELGAGTGAITRHLRRRLTPDRSYLGIEVNSDMVRFLNGKFPDMDFKCGKADQIEDFLEGRLASNVVSSLPWTVFTSEYRIKTLNAIYNALEPGGRFLTYMCINASISPQAGHFVRTANQLFSKVERSPVEWRNIPPAFIYICSKSIHH